MIREYHAPATVEEVVTLKARLGNSAVFLAGGTEVNSTAFSFAPEHVISLQRLPLADIRATEAELVIGAGCTIQQVIDSTDVPEIIKAAGRHIFNRHIRNVATVGGQLGSNRSCSNLLPILVALEAVVDVGHGGPTLQSVVDLAGPGATRAIPALQYIGEERKELITHVRVRTIAPARRVAVERYSRTANDLSILTAAVSLTRDGEAVVNPVIAAGGVAKHVIRLEAVEQALHGKPLPRREAIERLVAGHVSPITDIRGTAEFKRHLAGVLVAKALLRAYRQVGEQRQ
jgi:probable selenate reductase FAD-binding subunit